MGITVLSDKKIIVPHFKNFYFKYVVGMYDNLFLFHLHNVYGIGSNSYGEIGIGGKNEQDKIMIIDSLSGKNILADLILTNCSQETS